MRVSILTDNFPRAAYYIDMKTIVLGGGCFWCLDAIYQQATGVIEVQSGFSGGELQNPSYYDVITGTTGHAEVVRVQFDETTIPLSVMLDIFFASHNPTTKDRQGADVGTQYRSIIFYDNMAAKNEIMTAIERAQILWDKPIVTEVTPAAAFYPAEPEHQDYFAKQPASGYCSVVINPKLQSVRQSFSTWLR